MLQPQYFLVGLIDVADPLFVGRLNRRFKPGNTWAFRYSNSVFCNHMSEVFKMYVTLIFSFVIIWNIYVSFLKFHWSICNHCFIVLFIHLTTEIYCSVPMFLLKFKCRFHPCTSWCKNMWQYEVPKIFLTIHSPYVTFALNMFVEICGPNDLHSTSSTCS